MQVTLENLRRHRLDPAFQSQFIKKAEFGSLPRKVVVTGSIIFTLFVIVTAITYAYIEDWSYVDSLYFVVITISTIGYGDIVPKTPLGKLVNVIFAYCSFFGIFVIFRVVIGYVVDHQIESIIRRIKMKKRQQSYHRLRGVGALSNSLSLGNLANAAAQDIKKEEFDALKRGRNLQWVVHLVMYSLWLLLWTLFYSMSPDENHTVIRALYFGIITSTTIGYGNHTPASDQGKVFCFITALFGTMFLAILAGSVSQAAMSVIRTMFQKKTMARDACDQEPSVEEREPSVQESENQFRPLLTERFKTNGSL